MEFDFLPEYETPDVIPKEFQPLYAKGEDGKLRIHAALAKKLDVSGLQGALKKEREANREAAKALGAYKALGTPEEIQAKVDAARDAGDEAGAKRWEKMKAELVAGHEKEKSTLAKERDELRGSLDRYLVDSEATSALAELKGSPKLLLPHVRTHVKVMKEGDGYVARVVDKDGDPRVNSQGLPLTIKDLVGEMKKSPDYAMAFEASGNSGGGKRPGNSGGTPGGSMSSLDKIKAGLGKR